MELIVELILFIATVVWIHLPVSGTCGLVVASCSWRAISKRFTALISHQMGEEKERAYFEDFLKLFTVFRS